MLADRIAMAAFGVFFSLYVVFSIFSRHSLQDSVTDLVVLIMSGFLVLFFWERDRKAAAGGD